MHVRSLTVVLQAAQYRPKFIPVAKEQLWYIVVGGVNIVLKSMQT